MYGSDRGFGCTTAEPEKGGVFSMEERTLHALPVLNSAQLTGPPSSTVATSGLLQQRFAALGATVDGAAFS